MCVIVILFYLGFLLIVYLDWNQDWNMLVRNVGFYSFYVHIGSILFALINHLNRHLKYLNLILILWNYALCKYCMIWNLLMCTIVDTEQLSLNGIVSRTNLRMYPHYSAIQFWWVWIWDWHNKKVNSNISKRDVTIVRFR